MRYARGSGDQDDSVAKVDGGERLGRVEPHRGAVSQSVDVVDGEGDTSASQHGGVKSGKYGNIEADLLGIIVVPS